MLKWFHADLHIHTCLSPCADLTMSPKRVVEKSVESRIDIIGICDHNSAENVQAAKKVGSKYGITVLAGMEVNSLEEVHVLALFDTTEVVLDFQDVVYQNLTPGKNRQELFGQQIIANELDEVEGFNSRLLIGATGLTLKKICEEISKRGGLIIPAHVDRESFSLIGQLGFIPKDLPLDALEISSRLTVSEAMKRFPEISHFPLIRSSDAHFLEDIGSVTTSFLIAKPSIEEIRIALNRTDERQFKLEA